MKKVYAVMKISTATARNKYFAGDVHTSIYGKENKCLFHTGDRDGWTDKNFLAPYWCEKYGYARKCDAMRNWVYKNPQVDEPNWKSETLVVELRIRNDGIVHVMHIPNTDKTN